MVFITRSWRRNGCVRVDGGLAPQGGHHMRGRWSKTAPNCANRQTRYQHTAILLCIWLMPTERGATAETTDFKCQTKGKMRKKRTEGKKTKTKQSDGRSIIVSIRRELLVLSVRKKYTVLVCPNVLFLWNCVWKQYLAYGQVWAGGCLDTILASSSILHPQTNKNNLNGQILLTLENQDQCRTDLVSLTIYLWQAFYKRMFFLLLLVWVLVEVSEGE